AVAGVLPRGERPVADDAEHGAVLPQHFALQVADAPGAGLVEQRIEEPPAEPAPAVRIDGDGELAIPIGAQEVAGLADDVLFTLPRAHGHHTASPRSAMLAVASRKRRGGW